MGSFSPPSPGILDPRSDLGNPLDELGLGVLAPQPTGGKGGGKGAGGAPELQRQLSRQDSGSTVSGSTVSTTAAAKPQAKGKAAAAKGEAPWNNTPNLPKLEDAER